MWTPSPPCGTTVNVTVQQKTQTLYYIASSGQTQFQLSAADMFGNNVLLDGSQALAVYKGGLRLVPDNGTGAGGYTVDLPNNQINLLWPSGAGEILVVDLYSVVPDDGGGGSTGPQGPAGLMGPRDQQGRPAQRVQRALQGRLEPPGRRDRRDQAPCQPTLTTWRRLAPTA